MRRLLLLAVALMAVATACGGNTETPEALAFIDPFPPPSGEVVLTITGAAQPNVGSEVQIDIASIEALGLETVTVADPFSSSDLVFSGVSIEKVLAAAGISGDSPLTWTALDDYEVSYSGDEARANGGFLATRVDDQTIGIAEGGPVRIVFTEASDGDALLANDSNQWIWSLDNITVE